MGYDKNIVDLREKDLTEVLRVVEKDSRFLARHNIMDYSLLLVVETFKHGESLGTPQPSRHKYVSGN